MTKKNYIRARTEEQVEERINAILDAAGCVFHNEDYEKVTMLMIAKKAGFTRSNIYRYFKSREEIFLAIFIHDLKKWVEKIKSAFKKEMSVEEFVEKWTGTLFRQKRLVELAPLFAISLEKNTTEEVYRNTKVLLYGIMNNLLPSLKIVLPKINEEQFLDFMMMSQMLIAGGVPMGHYTAMQKKVLKELGVKCFDFKIFYKNSALIYLNGMTKEY